MQQRTFLFLTLLLIFLTSCIRETAPTPSAASTTTTPNTILMTSNGFEPASLTVSTGTTVTFVNKDTTAHWPASAIHPTHTVYPGSDIKKCSTNEKDTIFDACRSLQQDETFTFMFTNTGSWNYHDHLNPRMHGTVIVQ